MNGALVRFRLGVIPVTIAPSFFLTSLALGASRGGDMKLAIEWMLVVLLSVLVHELGHALAARSSGQTPSIQLHGMGGTTSYQPPTPLPTARRLFIAVAGPGAGFLFGGIAFLWSWLLPESGMLGQVQRDLLWANLGWGAVNLLPILPLDGGHAMESLVLATRSKRAPLLVQIISVGTGVAVLAAALILGWRSAAFLCGWLVLSSVLGHAAKRRHGQLTQIMREAGEAYQRKDAATAMALARRGIGLSDSVAVRDYLAKILASSGVASRDLEAAEEGLALISGEPDPSLAGMVLALGGRHDEAVPLLRRAMVAAELNGADGRVARQHLDAALFYAGRFTDAATIAEEGFARYHTPLFAYNAACSYARLGKADVALGWLGKSIAAGWKDTKMLDDDVDLAAVRALPGFAELRAQLRPV